MDIGYERESVSATRQSMIDANRRAQKYTGGNQSAGGVASPEKSVQGIERQLHRDIGGVNEAAARIRNIADELYGPESEEACDSTDADPCCGRMSSINDLQEQLRLSISDLHSQISRLERLA